MNDPLTSVTSGLLDDLSRRAAASPRRRMNHNLHPTLADPIQRLLNAFEPGTYVHPHRHAEPGRWELFVCLRGRAAVLAFDGESEVTLRADLEAGGPTVAVEVAAGVCHTIVSLSASTVMLEVKPGPYVALTDKDFAPWAPAEGDPASRAMVAFFERAAVGERPEP
jgi:cupin fold WbuC family metalloprotein